MSSPSKFAALLLALSLGACAAPQQCRVERITDLPLTKTRDFALLPARLNDVDARLLLDTGAGATMLSRALADRLALMPDHQMFPSPVNGIGGVTLTRRMVVESFKIGALDLGKQSVMVTEQGLFGGFDPPPDGIIGGDFLSHFDADIDLPANHVTLYRAHPCAAAFAPPWPGATIYRLPARMTDGGQFLVTVTVDGVAITAMIDSGAETTAISSRVENRLGLTPAMLANDPQRAEIGIDMHRRLSYLHPFHAIRIGAEIFPDSAVWVSDMPLVPADMLLGADFFQTHRVWLSFSRRTVFVAVAGNGGNQTPR